MIEIIKEIKKDLANDYVDMEYMELLDGYDWTFIIENDKVLYYWIEEDYNFSGFIDVGKFLDLSNDDIIRFINSDMYYNTQENY